MKNQAAQTAQEVEKPTMTVVKPQEEKPKAEVINKGKAEDVSFTPVVTTVSQIPTIEDIKRKGELLIRLSKRYDDLIEKRNRMENFKVSHDNDTAEILLHDAKGESFKSNSPKAIAKFIEFCKDEFSDQKKRKKLVKN